MAAKNKDAAAAVSHVDQASGVPLYLQVERILAHRIESGEWHPGEQIPNETKLCAQYGLSRVTMRQAVAGDRCRVVCSHASKDGARCARSEPDCWVAGESRRSRPARGVGH